MLKDRPLVVDRSNRTSSVMIGLKKGEFSTSICGTNFIGPLWNLCSI